jgi:hypothetical protein
MVWFRVILLRSEVAKKMAQQSRDTPSYIEARNMLPTELYSAFDALLADYKFAALKHHGKEWVAPKVLAELILGGWRPSAAQTSLLIVTKK